MTPNLLKAGSKIGIVAPSRVIFEDQLIHAIKVLESWGLEVIEGQSLYAQSGYFAGDDHERLIDMQHMINDNSIEAIFCARGGYGMTRFVDELDLSNLLSNPKWIIGFSDVTALHLRLNLLGLESIHGLMPVQFGYEGVAESIRSLYEILFKPNANYETMSSIECVPGESYGQLVGGNLSLICDSLGTASEVDTNDKILFIEEIDEYYYKIDRMLMQMKRAGKFDKLKGVIIGDFSKMRDTQIPFGKELSSVIMHYFKSLKIPVIFGFPAGHEPHHLALPFMRKVSLKVTEAKCELIL